MHLSRYVLSYYFIDIMYTPQMRMSRVLNLFRTSSHPVPKIVRNDYDFFIHLYDALEEK